MVNDNNLAQVLQQLEIQKGFLNELDIVLKNEQQAIELRDADLLKSTATEKFSLLNKIQNTDKHLQNFPIPELKKQFPQLAEIVDHITAQLKASQQQNDINAHASHQSQIAIKKVTEILIGSMKSMTYDSKGAQKSNSLLGKGIKA